MGERLARHERGVKEEPLLFFYHNGNQVKARKTAVALDEEDCCRVAVTIVKP